MNRALKLSLVCLGIFAAGAGSGVFATLRYQELKREARRSGPESFGPQMMRRFAERLELTADQQAAIQPILNETTAELRKLRRESYRTSGALIAGMEARMAELLTPAQREQLTVMQAEQRERIRQRMGEAKRRAEPADGDKRDGPPPPPPPEER